MNDLENEFFEEYKRLDSLCRDLLKSENGVSEYISQMETVPYASQSRIPAWEADYRALKHARWVRNDIAHGNGQSECTERDLDFVLSFHDRIMNCADPFSQLSQLHKKNVNENRHNPPQPRQSSNPQQPVCYGYGNVNYRIRNHENETNEPIERGMDPEQVIELKPEQRWKRKKFIAVAVLIFLLMIAAVLIYLYY